MEKYTKAILAFAGVLLPFLESVGVALPEFLTIDWVQGIILALTPVLVFYFPNKENGVNVAMSPRWVGVLALLIAALAMSGCAGTRAAYQAADGLEDTAKVVGEHYYILVSQLNDLAEEGSLVGSNLSRAQSIVQSTRPMVLELADAAQVYEAVKSAENEVELERALSRAAISISRLIDLVKAGGSTNNVIDDLETELQRIMQQLPDDRLGQLEAA